MSLDAFLPAPTVQIGDKTLQLKPFTINEIAKLQDWINKTYRSPLADALPVFSTLPPDVRDSVLRASKAWTPPQLGSPEGDDMLKSIHGLRQVFRILVTCADATITEAKADELAGTLSFEEFGDKMNELMEVAFGKSEGEDPKAE